MLDPVTGALFALGFLASILLIRRHKHFLLVLWVLVMTLPGVLSLDFEAPQSLRSIAVIPGVVMLAAWVLGSTWRGLELVLGRETRNSPRCPLLAWWRYAAFGTTRHTSFAARAISPSGPRTQSTRP